MYRRLNSCRVSTIDDAVSGVNSDCSVKLVAERLMVLRITLNAASYSIRGAPYTPCPRVTRLFFLRNREGTH